ncbi:MAG: (2Fe-2S) ferredoxin domain-containing protein [Candidatus Riflebacteria bacterium]|nr:(2Fe-2S) ferredoxin domain-containing protein [Candidatus Riflebacteria bacterium]
MSNDSNDMPQHEIIMCMGSACFTRGNKHSVEIVKQYLAQRNLQAIVTFKGCLCNNRCKAAPVITIDGHHFEKVLPQSVTEILDHFFLNDGGNHESA